MSGGAQSIKILIHGPEHSASEDEEIIQLSAWQMYQIMQQGGFESITTSKKDFDNALAAECTARWQ